MPHVQITGNPDLAGFSRRFAPRSIRDGETIIKAEECYLSSDGQCLLIECMVVEGYLRHGFFAMFGRRDDRATSRLHSRTSPEKTDGVKRCLAWLALWLKALTPGAAVGSTNLPDELARPFPGDAFPTEARGEPS